MSTKPFIHLFKCSTGFYLYDVNTDAILKITEKTYNLLRHFSVEENEQIIRLKREGYLKSKHVEFTEHPMTQFLDAFYKSRLRAITLQVTQNCNLRCDYCVYSGKYNTREHSDKRMSFEMAKKGIDFLLEHSYDRSKIEVAFYGGEPLLEFELIKMCVKYIEKKAPERSVAYSMTTNGTLLDEKKVAYLVEHRFDIMVSFDGPKEIHDKYRVFANSGKGTYDLVMKNVQYIKDTYPEFFSEHISFSTVLNPEEGYSCVGDYFNGEEVFKDSMFTANVISDLGVKENEKKSATEEFIGEYNYEYFKLLMSKLGWIREENTSIIARSGFNYIQRTRGGKHQSGDVELPEKWHHGGPCVPGERAIFMTVDGIFYPCEKVCEKADMAVMGDIEHGIDVEKAAKILNVEQCTTEECKSCWAYRYCNFCIRYAEVDQSEFKESILSQCEKMRCQVENVFRDYCVLRELGYDFEYGVRKRSERK